jgi:hypothetical protein
MVVSGAADEAVATGEKPSGSGVAVRDSPEADAVPAEAAGDGLAAGGSDDADDTLGATESVPTPARSDDASTRGVPVDRGLVADPEASDAPLPSASRSDGSVMSAPPAAH